MTFEDYSMYNCKPLGNTSVLLHQYKLNIFANCFTDRPQLAVFS